MARFTFGFIERSVKLMVVLVMTIAPMEICGTAAGVLVVASGAAGLGDMAVSFCRRRVCVRHAQRGEQVDGLVRLDDQPRVSIVHVNFLDGDGLRIQVRVNAAEAGANPISPNPRPSRRPPCENRPAGVAVKRDLRQLARRRAQTDLPCRPTLLPRM